MKRFLLVLMLFLSFSANAFARDVMFNVKSYKYHSPGCEHAHKCTKNCIRIDHTDAQRRGGIPCKVCGG
ncbi:MAG: hypothetical protein FWG18_01935 [Alphaproteobacteria bacterium]|nr:hypothetical protein [Alphaproteobacteria bacterium]